MKRYIVQCLLRTTQQPMELGKFDTPREAIAMGRRFEKQGMQAIEITDFQEKKVYPLAQFVAQNGG